MKRLVPLLILCALAPAVAGQAPPDPPKPTPVVPAGPPVAKATVTPPGPVSPGTFIRIDATATDASTILWDSDLDPKSYQVSPIEVPPAAPGLPPTYLRNRMVTLSAPATPGTYSFRLDAFRNVGGEIAADRYKPSFTVVGTIQPVPPPAPSPTPVPAPPPPSPPGDGTVGNLRVLVLYESSDKATADQSAALSSTAIRSYLSAKCLKGTTGLPEWRFWDKDVDTTNAAPEWRDAMAKAKAEATPLPKVVVFGGSTLVEARPIADEVGTLNYLQSKGGK